MSPKRNITQEVLAWYAREKDSLERSQDDFERVSTETGALRDVDVHRLAGNLEGRSQVLDSFVRAILANSTEVHI